MEKLKNLLNQAVTPLVIAGIADNQDDFLKMFNKIIVLRCPHDVLVGRLSTRNQRGSQDFGRDKVEQELLGSFGEYYDDKVIKQGAISIDADDAIDVVVEKIIVALQSQ